MVHVVQQQSQSTMSILTKCMQRYPCFNFKYKNFMPKKTDHMIISCDNLHANISWAKSQQPMHVAANL